MATKTIKDILDEIKNETKNNDVKVDIEKAQLDYWSKLISVALAAIGIVLGAMGVFGINKLPEGREYIYTYSIITAVIFLGLFFMLFLLLTKRITFYLAKNYTRLKDALEILDSTNNDYNVKINELQNQLNTAQLTTQNIANSPISNLISWYESGNLEIQANRVFAISINLNWLNEKVLNHIFDDLENNLDDKYFYIVAEKSPKTVAKVNKIKKLISKKDSEKLELKIKDRFNLANLYDLKICDELVYGEGSYTLPIPYDTVIYKSEKFRTAVISTKEVPENITDEDLMKNYDVKFTDEEQVDRIEFWFKNTWEKLTGENIEND